MGGEVEATLVGDEVGFAVVVFRGEAEGQGIGEQTRGVGHVPISIVDILRRGNARLIHVAGDVAVVIIVREVSDAIYPNC